MLFYAIKRVKIWWNFVIYQSQALVLQGSVCVTSLMTMIMINALYKVGEKVTLLWYVFEFPLFLYYVYNFCLLTYHFDSMTSFFVCFYANKIVISSRWLDEITTKAVWFAICVWRNTPAPRKRLENVFEYMSRFKPRIINSEYNTIQYNNNICRALFTKRPGALTETSDDMLCEIVQSLNCA